MVSRLSNTVMGCSWWPDPCYPQSRCAWAGQGFGQPAQIQDSLCPIQHCWGEVVDLMLLSISLCLGPPHWGLQQHFCCQPPSTSPACQLRQCRDRPLSDQQEASLLTTAMQITLAATVQPWWGPYYVPAFATHTSSPWMQTSSCWAATLTNELQFVIIEPFVGQQLLQEGYDLHGAVLIGLGQIYVPQVQDQTFGVLQVSCEVSAQQPVKVQTLRHISHCNTQPAGRLAFLALPSSSSRLARSPLGDSCRECAAMQCANLPAQLSQVIWLLCSMRQASWRRDS